MKQLLLLLLIALFIAGCRDSQRTVNEPETKDIYGLSIIVIDGCEYYKFRTYHSYYAITHKGNCKSKHHSKP